MPSSLPKTTSCFIRAFPILIAVCACAPTQNPVKPHVPAPAYGLTASQVKPADERISTKAIERYLERKAYSIRATAPGIWRLSVDGVLVLLVAEDSRVRILAPIFALNQLDAAPVVKHAVMVRLLQSNFERAADARYSVFDGIVFATVTHPRTTLVVRDLDGFLSQVVNLHKNTFRTGRAAYSSFPPEPGSTEIDPRLDDTLMLPDSFERKKSPQMRRRRPVDNTRTYL